MGLFAIVYVLIKYTSIHFLYILGVIIVLGGAIVIKHHSWCYLVTTDVIQSVVGIVSRNTSTIRISDLRSVNVKQSVLQRMLGTGDIEFGSAGSAGIEVVFKGVLNPNDVRENIYALMKGEFIRKCELYQEHLDKYGIEGEDESPDEICPETGMGAGSRK